MKSMNLPPYAPTLIESTRAIGYSLEAAIAHIIDNSITAGASHAGIFFFPTGGAYIAILDDGSGMSEAEIDRAMQYGSRNPADTRDAMDLGRFGLGLKTASLSQCRRLTVISKQGPAVLGRCWDIDHVAEAGEWSLLVLDEDEMAGVPEFRSLMRLESGTLVVWQKLDRLKAGEINFELAMGRRIDSVREHLSLVYHRYLSGEQCISKLRISINGSDVEPLDPFLKNKSTQPMDDETLIIRGQRIVVRPYILPHISRMTDAEIKKLGGKDGLRRQQGFYVYRNKRLLVWGTWFRMISQEDLSKLARIQVDIPNTLDELWTLDIKKSSAVPPAEVRRSLEAIVEKIAERSRRTWTYRGKKEVSDRVTHVWNRMIKPDGGVYYEINRDHPMAEQLVRLYPGIERILDSLFQQIERGLPLNQMHVDFEKDLPVRNEQKQSDEGIAGTLRQMISLCGSTAEKLALIDSMSGVEPFLSYQEAVEEVRKETAE